MTFNVCLFVLDEDDMAYKDDPEDKLYKEKKSLGDLALRGSDASETRQTRQKKRARNDSESSNGGTSEILLMSSLMSVCPCFLLSVFPSHFRISSLYTQYNYCAN